MPSKTPKTLEDLFIDQLKDIFYAEKMVSKTLPKLAKAANDVQLATAFEHHLQETGGHISRLEKVFELLGKPARGKTCPAIDGILEEGDEVMKDYGNSEALDAGLIASAQAVEHYEISRYRTLSAWATDLGMSEAAKLFDATLSEEEAADQKLASLRSGM